MTMTPQRALRVLRAHLAEHTEAQRALDTVAMAVAANANPPTSTLLPATRRHPTDGRTPAEVVEDVTWLADSGYAWPQIVAHMGRGSAALEKYLERHGQGELVARLGARAYNRADRRAAATRRSTTA